MLIRHWWPLGARYTNSNYWRFISWVPLRSPWWSFSSETLQSISDVICRWDCLLPLSFPQLHHLVVQLQLLSAKADWLLPGSPLEYNLFNMTAAWLPSVGSTWLSWRLTNGCPLVRWSLGSHYSNLCSPYCHGSSGQLLIFRLFKVRTRTSPPVSMSSNIALILW